MKSTNFIVILINSHYGTIFSSKRVNNFKVERSIESDN
jgi:hypothetical protein